MKAPTPKRFGPEWWAAYGAAYAVEQRAFVAADAGHDSFDRTRSICPMIAARCVVIADDAIRGFNEAVAGGDVDVCMRLTPLPEDIE